MVKADVDGVYTVNIGDRFIDVNVESGVGLAKINLPAGKNYISIIGKIIRMETNRLWYNYA